MKTLDILILIITAIAVGCSPQERLSKGEKYVIQAFDSIEAYSLHRHTFNFDSLEQQVLNRINDSTSHIEVIREIESAVKLIDRHNYVLTSEKYRQMETGTNPDVTTNPYPFQGRMLHNNCAFVSLSGFIGVDSTSAKNYTDSLQNFIGSLYDQQPKGWIIDLRYNSGGWIYPMLAGLGPLLGPGIKAYEISGNKIWEEFYFMKDSSDYLLLSDGAYFFEEQLPVAVLVGEGTGSAGELLALAFRGNPRTVLIGQPTTGVSTGLYGFFMPDSTQICVTNRVMTDRTKKGDGKKIQPDILVKEPIQMFERAYEWIENN